MTRSKLEKYLNILEVLVHKPLEFEAISYGANLECKMLKRYLDFLTLHKLVEERLSKNLKFTYALTDRGLAVFKTLQAREYFKKLRNTLVIDEA